MKRFTALSLALALFFAAPAAVLAKSYTGNFRISVVIPPSINSDAQALQRVEKISEDRSHSADISMVETIRDDQLVLLKTSVVR